MWVGKTAKAPGGGRQEPWSNDVEGWCKVLCTCTSKWSPLLTAVDTCVSTFLLQYRRLLVFKCSVPAAGYFISSFAFGDGCSWAPGFLAVIQPNHIFNLGPSRPTVSSCLMDVQDELSDLRTAQSGSSLLCYGKQGHNLQMQSRRNFESHLVQRSSSQKHSC